MNYIAYASGYKYQLRAAYVVLLPELADPTRAPIRTEWIELEPDGTLRLREGYASDGPSGPTIDTKSSIRGSFVHDAGYQLIRLGLLPHALRPVLDKVLYRLLLEDKMFPPRAWMWYRLVGEFGDPAADPAHGNPTQWAPKGP